MLNKKKINQNVMILEFLNAELDSSRFKDKIHKALNELDANAELITNANLEDAKDNHKRKKIFNLYRNFESTEGLFEGFPSDIDWYEADITKDELLNQVYYINYDYWVELSNKSRLPKDAAKSIMEGKIIFEVSNDGFLSASKSFRSGKNFNKLILVSDGNKIVVLEGHLRITVYAMNPDLLPETIPIIVGYSNEMNKWSSF